MDLIPPPSPEERDHFHHPDPRECFVHIGKRIQQIRRSRGLTQSMLAARIRCSRDTLANWEQMRREPTYYFLPPLAAALQCRIADLFVYYDKHRDDAPKAAGMGPRGDQELGVLEEVGPPPPAGHGARHRTYTPAEAPEPRLPYKRDQYVASENALSAFGLGDTTMKGQIQEQGGDS